MSITTESMTPADIAAVTSNNNCSSWGGDFSSWIIIFLIFAMFGWGGNAGFGGNSGREVANQYVLNSDFATLQRQLSDGFNSTERKADSISNGLCDGFYAQNTTMLNGFSGVANAISTNGYETRNAIQNAQINEMQNSNAIQTQIANCCCDIKGGIADINYNNSLHMNNLNRAIDGINYNLATNTCAINTNINNSTRDIVENQNCNTRAILDALTAQRIEAKDNKIMEQQNTIQALNLAASQSAQNQYLINQLKPPCPVPSFVVPNPYAYNNCNCNC